MKKIFIFFLGFISCLIFVFILINFNFLPFINKNDSLIGKNDNEESNVINEETNKNENNVLYTNFNDDDIEHRIKVSYPIIINGEEKDISSFELDEKTYVSIEELSELLNNLKIQRMEESKSLVIYECSGLGIVKVNDEKYIEVTKLANRYEVMFGELPYIYMPTGRTFLDSNDNNRGTTKRLSSIVFYDKKFSYDSIFIKQEDLKKEMTQYLKIINANENEIMNNPDKYKLFPY